MDTVEIELWVTEFEDTYNMFHDEETMMLYFFTFIEAAQELKIEGEPRFTLAQTNTFGGVVERAMMGYE